MPSVGPPTRPLPLARCAVQMTGSPSSPVPRARHAPASSHGTPAGGSVHLDVAESSGDTTVSYDDQQEAEEEITGSRQVPTTSTRRSTSTSCTLNYGRLGVGEATGSLSPPNTAEMGPKHGHGSSVPREGAPLVGSTASPGIAASVGPKTAPSEPKVRGDSPPEAAVGQVSSTRRSLPEAVGQVSAFATRPEGFMYR